MQAWIASQFRPKKSDDFLVNTLSFLSMRNFPGIKLSFLYMRQIFRDPCSSFATGIVIISGIIHCKNRLVKMTNFLGGNQCQVVILTISQLVKHT